MSGHSYVQWKIAMARMQDANPAAATIDPTKSTVTQRATRKIAEDHLKRYFDIVATKPPHDQRRLFALLIFRPRCRWLWSLVTGGRHGTD
jgi:hypothetical protein